MSARQERASKEKPEATGSPSGSPLPAALLAANLPLNQLQEFQQLHDERFHPDVMAMAHDRQVEHSMMHLAKLAGLLATICEKKHHGEATEEIAFTEQRIADLLVFALKLANLYHIDVDEAFRERLLKVEEDRQA